MSDIKNIKITLIRSTNKALPKHKATVKGLGLRRMHHSIVVLNNACTRGMINKVNHLLLVEEV